MRTGTSSPLTEADVRTALRDCYDPAVRANILDLGCVDSISIELDSEAPGSSIAGVPPRYRVVIDLVPTSLDEAANAQVIALIENRLAASPAISRTRVDIVAGVNWTPARMAPALRTGLELAIASNQRSHDLVQIQTQPAKTLSE